MTWNFNNKFFKFFFNFFLFFRKFKFLNNHQKTYAQCQETSIPPINLFSSDVSFKIVIVGSSFTGKSSLILRFADDVFSETYHNTIGVDFVSHPLLTHPKKFKLLKVDDKMVKLQLVLYLLCINLFQWDTAGQEKFRTITSTYYKQADAILIVADQSSKKSFEDIKDYWIGQVKEHSDRYSQHVLILNKMDVQNKELDPEEVQAFSKQYGLLQYETSAKTGKNVTGVFVEICRQLIREKYFLKSFFNFLGKRLSMSYRIIDRVGVCLQALMQVGSSRIQWI